MNWENLKTFECPYCGHPLLNTVPDICCSHCDFIIARDRFKRILSNRTNEKPAKPMRWQNLRDARCPLCSDLLVYVTEGKSLFEKCIVESCGFKISHFQVETILADPAHPANKFYKEPTVS